MGRLTSRYLRDYIDVKSENVILKKYPGHTADEINYYADHPLEHIKPKQVIVIAGTNDISEGYREKNLDETKIVANILNIARKAKFYGADKVYIASILERRGLHYKNIISRINEKLYMSCLEKGYNFIDNSDIVLDYISRDGIHPNEQGHCILKMNILKCMYSFNPYFCDFTNYYEKCLL